MSDARAAYNARQSGTLWSAKDLPAPLNTLDPASAAFADAVAAAQKAKGLTADGMLGPTSLAAIAPKAPGPVPAPTGNPSADKLLESLHAELRKGVKETGGMNRGADVEKYQKTVGLKAGDPWCAAFVTWNIMNARGLTSAPAWCSGSVATLWHKASKKVAPSAKVTPLDADFKSKVKPGWVWCRAKDPVGAKECRAGTWVLGHTGIVVKVDDTGWHTIEGNTNAAGSRDGDGVYMKHHLWTNAAQVDRTIGWFDPSGI